MSIGKKVLISGFEPFGGSDLNSSQLVVEAISKESLSGLELSAVILPVEFDKAARVLLSKVNDFNPEIIISFGQAEGRKAITPEKIAINLDSARIPDNAGELRVNKVIVETGADGYFSTLPIEKMVAAVKECGLESEISLSAGAFLCNHIFYHLQHQLLEREVKSGFVHLPLVNEQIAQYPNQPSWALKDLVQGVRAAILSTL
ncbi:MAG: pyroglutamyl-peptidase I [Candidatus Nanopelagicaceae bacterium]